MPRALEDGIAYWGEATNRMRYSNLGQYVFCWQKQINYHKLSLSIS